MVLPAVAYFLVGLEQGHCIGNEIIEVQQVAAGEFLFIEIENAGVDLFMGGGFGCQLNGFARRNHGGQFETADGVAGFGDCYGFFARYGLGADGLGDDLFHLGVVQTADVFSQAVFGFEDGQAHAMEAANDHAFDSGFDQSLADFHFGVAVEGHA